MERKHKEEKNKMDKEMENYIKNYNIQKEQRQLEHDKEMNRLRQQNQMEINNMNHYYNMMKQNQNHFN